MVAWLFASGRSQKDAIQSVREVCVGGSVILVGLNEGSKADSKFVIIVNNTMGDKGVGT